MIELDEKLQNKVQQIFTNFDRLATLNKQFILAFSGGKDSHCLLGLYLWWCNDRQQKLDIEVTFSDTYLEESSLYQIIDRVQSFCESKLIKFKKVLPKKTYWFYQFAYGYPVPDWKIRWCTQNLKIQPMVNKSKIALTGRHYGESKVRDDRLNKCSSGECGIEDIKSSYDPIVHLRNCDVWDLLYFLDGTFLYNGCFNLLSNTYLKNSNDRGSLRMGCVMCPVIATSTLFKRANDNQMIIRFLLEELRQCRRINNPKTKKRGAIYINDRIEVWHKIKPYLIAENIINQNQIKEIESYLERRSYPPSYSQEWINQQHKLLPKRLVQLSLF